MNDFPLHRLDLSHVHRNFHLMLPTARKNSRHRTHIAKVASICNRDVLLTGLHVVRGIEVHPTFAGAKHTEPRMTRIRTNEPRLALRRTRAQITTDITGGQTERPKKGDAQMSEVLTNAAALL